MFNRPGVIHIPDTEVSDLYDIVAGSFAGVCAEVNRILSNRNVIGAVFGPVVCDSAGCRASGLIINRFHIVGTSVPEDTEIPYEVPMECEH